MGPPNAYNSGHQSPRCRFPNPATTYDEEGIARDASETKTICQPVYSTQRIDGDVQQSQGSHHRREDGSFGAWIHGGLCLHDLLHLHAVAVRHLQARS
ncbi:hypothetical protein PC119_g20542 [Phytophthora cactorum]|nr:hypothetical protein PC111_g16305 [Phytophthora cactorum]KAG2983785.1 hypothetical protein PC119_g20542 [Phytophthora cactorum]KAG3026562.1 hypothetical protein PC120_g5852 [Phytophthora cactorum]